MTSTALRKKLHGYIDTMPEKNLAVIRPLLSVLAEPLYTIEPATPEESRKAEKAHSGISQSILDIIQREAARIEYGQIILNVSPGKIAIDVVSRVVFQNRERLSGTASRNVMRSMETG